MLGVIFYLIQGEINETYEVRQRLGWKGYKERS